jgi:hypothetical protein
MRFDPGCPSTIERLWSTVVGGLIDGGAVDPVHGPWIYSTYLSLEK